MSKKKERKIIIGVSIGDPNGIGLEVILKTFEDNRICELCTPVIFAAKKICSFYLKKLQLGGVNLNYVDSIENIKTTQVNVVEVWKEDFKIESGVESSESGSYAFKSLQASGEALKKGEVDALITAPINKKAIQSADFDFPGHTEYLQKLDESEDSLMLMLSERAKIGVVTGHMPLKEVSKKLTSELILRKISILNKTLKEDFNIRKPKIAIMGLNPHAGDNGLLGSEEIEVIVPAINQAKSIEILAVGPFAADGFFGSSNYKNFDGILAMYHDQGLIPAKSFSFGEGTNFTAGLNIIRTSPDHGTAFEIAGQGLADPTSFRNAIYQALTIVKNRKLNIALEADALVVNKNRN